MRRTIFFALGVLEILSAAVLYAFVWQLPGPDDVRDTVGRIERVSRQTGSQVRKLRDEIHNIQQSQPHAKQLAEGTRVQLQYLGQHLQKQQIDYVALQTLHDSFGEVARGVDGLSERLAPEGFEQLGMAMGLTANYLEKDVCPAAAATAERLDKIVAEIRADARTRRNPAGAAAGSQGRPRSPREPDPVRHGSRRPGGAAQA